MLTKSQIQLITSLRIKKYRSIEGRFVVEGRKMVQELLQSDFQKEFIYANEEWIKENRQHIKSNIPINLITEKELNLISTLKTPNQVVAVVKIPGQIEELPDLEKKIVLMLDNISDPGNLGTIIRTADWFGLQHIICSEGCTDAYNPKVVQATMGSIFRVKIQYRVFNEFLNQLSAQIPVFGTLLDGKSIYETELSKNGLIIIGNESHGISSPLLPFIKNKIRIPGYSSVQSSKAESLNASIATAIVLAEFRRRFPN
jgi:TrmH family RNA methyltransferase